MMDSLQASGIYSQTATKNLKVFSGKDPGNPNQIQTGRKCSAARVPHQPGLLNPTHDLPSALYLSAVHLRNSGLQVGRSALISNDANRIECASILSVPNDMFNSI